MTLLSIYHNPRCRKSREALNYLINNKIKHIQVHYLKNGISKKEIESILKKIKIKPEKLIRIQEKVWKESYKNKNLNRDELISAISDNPILMERPIITNDNSGVIGRPIDNLKYYLEKLSC